MNTFKCFVENLDWDCHKYLEHSSRNTLINFWTVNNHKTLWRKGEEYFLIVSIGLCIPNNKYIPLYRLFSCLQVERVIIKLEILSSHKFEGLQFFPIWTQTNVDIYVYMEAPFEKYSYILSTAILPVLLWEANSYFSKLFLSNLTIYTTQSLCI